MSVGAQQQYKQQNAKMLKNTYISYAVTKILLARVSSSSTSVAFSESQAHQAPLISRAKPVFMMCGRSYVYTLHRKSANSGPNYSFLTVKLGHTSGITTH